MSLKKKNHFDIPSEKVNTVIGKDTSFKGSITSKGLIRVDGEMEGEINTQGDLVIGESGKADVELKARSAAVAGQLKGTIELSGKLEIKSTGSVTGSIKINGLVIEDGAVFSGSCEMKPKAQGAAS